MRTPLEVIESITAYLEPAVLARCHDRGIQEPRVWFPHGYGHRELQASEWPAVFVDEVGDGADLLDHTEDGDPVFDVAWQLAIEGWVAATERDDWIGAKRHRGALKAVLFEVLVDKPGAQAEGLIIDDTAIASDYSPMFKTKPGLPCCAFELRITVHTAELVARDVLAEPPIDIDVTTEPLDEED